MSLKIKGCLWGKLTNVDDSKHPFKKNSWQNWFDGGVLFQKIYDPVVTL